MGNRKKHKTMGSAGERKQECFAGSASDRQKQISPQTLHTVLPAGMLYFKRYVTNKTYLCLASSWLIFSVVERTFSTETS